MRANHLHSPGPTANAQKLRLLWRASLGLLAALIAVLPGVGQQQVNAALPAADGDIVGAVTFQHEIDFGRSVHIEMEAEVANDVIEVRAVFAPLGSRRISSYAYPDFALTPGTPGASRLNAKFEIRTGGSAYVPPGTEFEVFFELTGADGSVTTTQSERILYLDPEKDWQLLESEHTPLDFYYYGFSRGTAAALERRVAETWLDIASAIGLETDGVDRFRAVIYPNVREMTPVFPPTSAAASDGRFFGGFAMQRYGVFVLGGPWADSVVHELTHLLIDTKVSSPLSPGVPSWLHEGLAQFFEAGSSAGYTAQLGPAASRDELLTLRNRNTVPARSNEISLFYTQVGSFVGGLIESFGPEPMAETLSLINEGKQADEAIEIAYGEPLWLLENEWRAGLGASELPPPPEPTLMPDTNSNGQTDPTSTSIPTSQPQPTVEATVSEVGVSASGDGSAAADGDNGGFNWTGPVIGAAAAAVVFFAWSYRVNRRRFRAHRHNRGQ